MQTMKKIHAELQPSQKPQKPEARSQKKPKARRSQKPEAKARSQKARSQKPEAKSQKPKPAKKIKKMPKTKCQRNTPPLNTKSTNSNIILFKHLMDVSRCVSFWASFAGVCAKSVTIGHSVKVHHQLLSQFHLHKYCKTDDMYLINIVYMYIYIHICLSSDQCCHISSYFYVACPRNTARHFIPFISLTLTCANSSNLCPWPTLRASCRWRQQSVVHAPWRLVKDSSPMNKDVKKERWEWDTFSSPAKQHRKRKCWRHYRESREWNGETSG